MLRFVGKVFRVWVDIVLWVILTGCAISGGIIAYSEFGGIFIILGVISGAFVGFIINISFGGLLANFLNMVENIEKLANGRN